MQLMSPSFNFKFVPLLFLLFFAVLFSSDALLISFASKGYSGAIRAFDAPELKDQEVIPLDSLNLRCTVQLSEDDLTINALDNHTKQVFERADSISVLIYRSVSGQDDLSLKLEPEHFYIPVKLDRINKGRWNIDIKVCTSKGEYFLHNEVFI